MDNNDRAQLGQVVKVLRGRDAGKYAIVIRPIEDKFVWVADGNLRKFDQPKKKNILHLEVTNEISKEVVESIRETGRVTNGKIRFALSRFAEQLQTDAT